MTTHMNDKVLKLTQLLLMLLAGLLIFTMVMVGIGIGAILTVQRGEIYAMLAEAGAPASGYWVILAALALVVFLLFLGFRFIRELMHVATSVEKGEPFDPENADRIARMGWITLAVQGVSMVLLPLALWLKSHFEALNVEDTFSLTGFLLALVLFVLARVFRHGTEMREELEGTI
ncbi:DUF2975 domain-containing protein [Sphingorhabdus sp. Alg239-R122]|uniref:DUF2975 domain-containing protein n=1 Tax=Sphingorhabdus sp. Alg239-R122 TaxID=2305989 RepID=UPI0013DA62B0|nr:DUF2975 domain-containing protein [Sphingorhabdus sp. Alg239-R122]